MAATTIIRPGAANLATDKTANFLTKANGLLIAEFQDNRILAGKFSEIQVPPGQVAVQVPRYGSVGGGYYSVGDNVIEDGSYLQNMRAGVITVAADKRLTSNVMLDPQDMDLNYWDIKSATVSEMGRFLADTYDQALCTQVIKGARISAGRTYADEPGGHVITVGSGHSARTDPTGTELITGVFAMAKSFRAKRVPMRDVHIGLPWDVYYKFVEAATAANLILNVDVNPQGNGSVAMGNVNMVAGFQVWGMDNFPAAGASVSDSSGTALASTAAAPAGSHRLDGASGTHINDYSWNPTTLMGIAWHSDALIVAKFAEPSFHMESKIEYMGATLAQARYIFGLQVKRPECCGIFVWGT